MEQEAINLLKKALAHEDARSITIELDKWGGLNVRYGTKLVSIAPDGKADGAGSPSEEEQDWVAEVDSEINIGEKNARLLTELLNN